MKNYKESQKNNKQVNYPTVRIYISKIDNSITFKVLSSHYLELLTPETIKLLEALKIRQLKIKTVKMFLIQKLLKYH